MPPQTPSQSRPSASNLTPETPVLAGALAALAGLVSLAPDLALVVVAVPAAVLLGVGTLAAAARVLSR